MLSLKDLLAYLCIAEPLLVSHVANSPLGNVRACLVKLWLDTLRLELDHNELMVVSEKQETRYLEALGLILIMEKLGEFLVVRINWAPFTRPTANTRLNFFCVLANFCCFDEKGLQEALAWV